MRGLSLLLCRVIPQKDTFEVLAFYAGELAPGVDITPGTQMVNDTVIALLYA